MNIKPPLIIGLALTFLAIVALSIYLLPGKVSFKLDESSAIKKGVEVRLSSDGYTERLAVPTTKSLRPGSYFAIASAPDAESVSYEFKISALGNRTLNVSLKPSSPSEVADEVNPGPNTLEEIPFYQYFPYNGGDYTITAEVDLKSKKIVKLIVTVFHRFAGPDEKVIYDNEREVAVTAAKSYLSGISFPAEIEITTIDK